MHLLLSEPVILFTIVRLIVIVLFLPKCASKCQFIKILFIPKVVLSNFHTKFSWLSMTEKPENCAFSPCTVRLLIFFTSISPFLSTEGSKCVKLNSFKPNSLNERFASKLRYRHGNYLQVYIHILCVILLKVNLFWQFKS